MALSSFLGRRNNLRDTSDPFEMVVSLFDNTPASSFVRDAHAVASTNVDWKETPTEHVFKADLPGLKKEEVQVQIEDDRTLSISGQRKKEEVQKEDTWHRVERSSGQFLRKFRLPENANLDRIAAKVENGVLTVVVPKEEMKKIPKTRSIEIGGMTANKWLYGTRPRMELQRDRRGELKPQRYQWRPVWRPVCLDLKSAF